MERVSTRILFITRVFVSKTSGSPRTCPSASGNLFEVKTLNQTLGVELIVWGLTSLPGEVDAH